MDECTHKYDEYVEGCQAERQHHHQENSNIDQNLSDSDDQGPGEIEGRRKVQKRKIHEPNCHGKDWPCSVIGLEVEVPTEVGLHGLA